MSGTPPIVPRNQHGQFVPGHTGNPLGRTTGFAGMARAIQRETQDGAELRAFALKVFRNEENLYTLADQWRALEWLSDRGYGKPVTMVDVQAHVQSTGAVAMVEVDERAVAAMPPDDFARARETLRRLVDASRAIASAPARRPPTDAELRAIDAESREVEE